MASVHEARSMAEPEAPSVEGQSHRPAELSGELTTRHRPGRPDILFLGNNHDMCVGESPDCTCFRLDTKREVIWPGPAAVVSHRQQLNWIQALSLSLLQGLPRTAISEGAL